MHLTIVGTGYVGLVAGACFAETGNTVTCADTDARKIDGLTRNELPIYEPGLEDLVERNQRSGRLRFTTDIAAAVTTADIIVIAVGTPQDEDGSADLRHVLAVAETIGRHITREVVIVTKSTVPVGTAARVRDVVGRHATVPFHVASNPEFLKEGSAIDDFMKPDRVVIGTDAEFPKEVLASLYAPFVRTGKPILFMDIASAELTKYAANAMLATRISFMNSIARLCERTGADIEHVRRGIGSDARIGPSFLFAGIGYGGSCFPKDVKALIKTGEEHGSLQHLLYAVESVNASQKELPFRQLHRLFRGDLVGKRIALWGLAFKPGTDDMREAPSLVLIDLLLAAGAAVVVHDPVAMREAKRRLAGRVTFAATAYEACVDADALVVVTEWHEYRSPDFRRIGAAMRRPVLVDGRNLYEPGVLRALGFTYRGVGRGAEQ